MSFLNGVGHIRFGRAKNWTKMSPADTQEVLAVQGSGMHPWDFERGTVSATFTSLTVAAGDAAGSALSVSHETNLFCLSCTFAEVCIEAGSLQCACEGCEEWIQAQVKSTLQQKPAPNLISEFSCGREGGSSACVIDDKVWANTRLLARVPQRKVSQQSHSFSR